MCEIMHVSRSGYYKWLDRDKPVDDKRQKAVEAVRKAHQEHTSHGYRWICAYLKENNIIAISESYTYKIMKVLGLKSETRHKLHYKPRKVKDKYPNLLFSTWETVDRPFQVIVSDMTAFKAKRGQYYEVTFYFDVFTKQILSWSLTSRKGDRMQYINGLEQVLAIIEANGIKEPVILHTDQGAVYASQAYNDLIDNSVIIRSMSRAGKPTDNPVNESLNGWIKEELFIDFHLEDSDDVEQTIKNYIGYYNNRRPSYSLGYVTPNHFYRMFMSGEIPHKDTFSSRELSAIPKFVRKKMESAAAKLRAEQDAWPYSFLNKGTDKDPKSIEEALEVFNDATDFRKNK